MPRRPDSPCAGGCGQLLWAGRGSLPSGDRCCRECRAKGLAPKAVDQSARRSDRQCTMAGCMAKHFAKGACRRHYYQARWAEGRDGSTLSVTVLTGMASLRGATAPTPKPIQCRVAVGVLADCPACGAMMGAHSDSGRTCPYCSTVVELNPEEVEWLISETHSILRSQQTA